MKNVEDKAKDYVKEHFGDPYDWEQMSMSKHTFFYELRQAFIAGYIEKEEEEERK